MVYSYLKYVAFTKKEMQRSKLIYKIAKIVRAFWLAERCVCMRVCKHGCDVKMFCFSLANHASTNLETFWSWKLDKRQDYFICPFSRRLELVKSLQTCRIFFFFRLNCHFNRKKSVEFGKHLFCKTRTDYVCRVFVYRTSRLIRISH